MTAHAPVRPDRIMRAALGWFAFTTVIFWLPVIRGAFDGSSYRWGLVGLSGKGVSGDYWFPLVGVFAALAILAAGWRLKRWAFAVMSSWNVGLLASTIAVVASNPGDFRVRGDTFGLDISLAWVGPALAGVGVIVSVMAAWRMFSMPQVDVEWSSRNFWWLVALTAALPIQFVLLRFGAQGSLSDRAGVVITIVQWLLIGRIFRPYAQQATSGPPGR